MGGISSGGAMSGQSGGAGPGPGPVQTGRQMGAMRMGDRDRFFDRDHDHDRDRFRFRHRFFPAFAFNNYYYSDYTDYSNCWEIQRVHTRYGWRLDRVWVCNYDYNYNY
jgi:hypothetical protein